MSAGLVRVECDGGVARVVLDHPPLNILTRALMHSLRQALVRLEADQSVRVVLLSATGRHFSAGADVAEHLPPSYQELIPEFLETVLALDRFPLPVIAAVRGRCLGGGFELVLGADLIVAAETAVFGQPEITLGVVPPAAAALLPGRCARGLAAELVLTGDPVSAVEAAGAGLVRRVVAEAELEPVAQGLAQRIARHSRAALGVAKRSLRLRWGGQEASSLAAAGDEYVHTLMATADAVEGLNAFLEKRSPAWSHR